MEHWGAEGPDLGGSSYFLRPLSPREAALDAMGDEISAIWISEGRTQEALDLLDFLEWILGPDAFLTKKFGLLYRSSCNAKTGELTDPVGMRKAMECTERLRRVTPNNAEAATFQLLGYWTMLKDLERSREVAEEILKNPKLPKSVTRLAWRVLNEDPPK